MLLSQFKKRKKAKAFVRLTAMLLCVLLALSSALVSLATNDEPEIIVDGGPSVISPVTVTPSPTKSPNGDESNGSTSTDTDSDRLSGEYELQFRDQSKDVTGNHYILQVKTAASSGKNIGFFEIIYSSVDSATGMELYHTEIIYPAEAKAAAVKFAKENGPKAANADFAEAGAMKSTVCKEILDDHLYYDDFAEPSSYLQANSVDYFYFSPVFELKKVISVKCFGDWDENAKSSENEWGLNYLEIMKVTECNGVTRVGTLGDYIPCVDGNTVYKYESTSGLSFSFGGTNGMLTVPGEVQNTSSQRRFDSYDYVTLELDIADTFGAGLEELIFGVGNGTDWGKNNGIDSLMTAKFKESVYVTVNYKDKKGYNYSVQIPMVTSYILQALQSLPGEYVEFTMTQEEYLNRYLSTYMQTMGYKWNAAGVEKAKEELKQEYVKTARQYETDKLTDETWFECLFGQGDIIRVVVYLPNYESTSDFGVLYTNDRETAEKYFAFPADGTTESKSYSTGSDGTFSVSGLSIFNSKKLCFCYDNRTVNTVINYYYETSSFGKFEIPPEYYYLSPYATGAKIEQNSKTGVTGLTAAEYDYSAFTRKCDNGQYDEIEPYRDDQRNNANLYLVTITTDSAENAGTVDGVSFRLNYKAESNGLTASTGYMSLEEACRSYYGAGTVRSDKETYTLTNEENPFPIKECSETVNGQTKKVQRKIGPEWYVNRRPSKFESYLSHAASGETLSFFISVSDVDYFTSMNLKKDGKDDWQFNEVVIYKVTNTGTRVVTELAQADYLTFTAPGVLSNDMYTKGYNLNNEVKKWGYDPIAPEIIFDSQKARNYAKDGVNFCTDRQISREFDAKIELSVYRDHALVQAAEEVTINFEEGTVEKEEENYSEYIHHMTYDDTKKDFGFGDAKVNYQVIVQVGGDINTSSDNGNCGSTDYFHFQLVFADGRSCYVLANTQLSADGFRTGKQETFVISTNRDYGELRAVHIIPESAKEDAESFDKLMISTIKVIKVGTSTVSQSWEINVNQWISIDYVDSGAKDSVKGQAGRTESELARTFNVTKTCYDINVMIAIETGNYDADSQQASGGLFADIKYLDRNGTQRSISPQVDIVSYIHKYANIATSQVEVGGKYYSAIDQSFMLRDGKTDRFVISIPDLKSLISIKFSGYSNESYIWPIEKVTAYSIQSEGRVILNSDGEYVSTAEYERICETGTTEELVMVEGAKYGITDEMIFSDNTVEVKVQESEMKTVIDTYPLSTDDTVNVYLFMAAKSDPLTEYTMKAAFQYKESGKDQKYQTSMTLTADPENRMFYKTGIAASNLASICNFSVQAKANSVYTRAYPSYARVEHVRSGVIIKTTYFKFDSGSNAVAGVVTTSDTGYSAKKNIQVLQFMTTDDTQEALYLNNRTDDVAVSITYVSQNGTLTHSLTSKNLFFSELGIETLDPGQIYTVQFEQENVSEVISVNFTAIGDAVGTVGIQNAFVANYNGSVSEANILSWDSFADAIPQLSAAAIATTKTDGYSEYSNANRTVGRLNISIKTAEAQTDYNTGTDAPIRLTVSYYDANSKLRTVTYDNVRKHGVSGSTNVGDTWKLSMLVNNVTSIYSVQVAPIYQAGVMYPKWDIEQMTLEYTVNGKTYTPTRKVDAIATESEPVTVSFVEVTIAANVAAYDATKNTNISRTFTTGKTGETVTVLSLTKGTTVNVTPTVTGSKNGVTCTCQRVLDNGSLEDATFCIDGYTGHTVNKVVFNASEEGTYRLTFTSTEFNKISLTVPIVVKVATATATPAA